MANNENWILNCKRGTFNGCTFPVQATNICIGTDPNICAVIYPENTNGIAPLHCQITFQNNGWVITDFSDSGTLLNGIKLIQGQMYPLKDGDFISLVDSSNSFIFSKSSTPTPSDETLKEKFFKYEGRLNRKPYIMRMLIVCAVSFIVSFILVLILTVLGVPEDTIYLISVVLSLPFSFAGVTLGIRRLHDTNHSGWWLLIGMVPIIGWFYLMYLLYLKKGTEGINRFGADSLN